MQQPERRQVQQPVPLRRRRALQRVQPVPRQKQQPRQVQQLVRARARVLQPVQERARERVLLFCHRQRVQQQPSRQPERAIWSFEFLERTGQNNFRKLSGQAAVATTKQSSSKFA